MKDATELAKGLKEKEFSFQEFKWENVEMST